MLTRKLGSDGPSVSSLSLGALHFGVYLDEAEATRLIHHACDLGITFVDTAPLYGRGKSEQIVGRALSDRKGKVLISTKVGLAPTTRADGAFAVETVPLTPEAVGSSVDRSLSELGIEAIDVLQLHAFDHTTPPEVTAEAVAGLISAGKIRYVGVSNYDADELTRMAHAFEGTGVHPVSLQCHFNLLERRALSALLPICEELGVGLLCNRGLARGILSGQYSPNAEPPTGSRAADSPRIRALLQPDLLALVEDLAVIARDHGMTLVQLALRWLLCNQQVSSVIVGTRRLEQLTHMACAAEASIPPEILAQIDSTVAKHGFAQRVAATPETFFEK